MSSFKELMSYLFNAEWLPLSLMAFHAPHGINSLAHNQPRRLDRRRRLVEQVTLSRLTRRPLRAIASDRPFFAKHVTIVQNHLSRGELLVHLRTGTGGASRHGQTDVNWQS